MERIHSGDNKIIIVPGNLAYSERLKELCLLCQETMKLKRSKNLVSKSYLWSRSCSCFTVMHGDRTRVKEYKLLPEEKKNITKYH